MNTTKWMCVILVMAGLVGTAKAQSSGTWTNTAAGPFNWGTSGNWSGGTIADGADNTATFSSSLTANQVVNLEANRTIGNITNSTSGNYTRTIIGANTLTLDRTSGIPTIDVASSRTLTIGTPIAGSDGLQKTGAGILILTNANSYTGGTFINGGTVTMSLLTAANLGGTGANITFNGDATLQGGYGGAYIFGSLTINSTATLSGGSGSGNYMTFTNPVTGSGTIKFASSGNGYASTLNFTSTANTFTGSIIFLGNANNGNDTINFNSLADGVGAGSLQIGANNRPTCIVNYGNGAIAPLTFNYRQIVMSGTASGATFNNNATNVNCAVTVNTDLGVSGVGNKTFTLGGSNTNNNTFAGAITNGAGSVISFTKANAGKWILAGANTYTGTTTISDGTLEFASSATYAGNISVTDTTPNPLTFSGTYTQTVSGAISGTMSLIKEGVGTLSLTGANTYTNTMVNVGTLSLGNGTSSSSLYDFSTLSVASGAKVNLNFTGTDKVFFLNLGGSPAAKGTWGATDSGASNINDTYFTGTGVIDNLNGDTTSLNIAFWDGGTVDIGTAGNSLSAGGVGTWNTTLMNWDFGFIAHKAWPITPAFNAYFGGSVGTVTVGEPVNVSNMTFTTTSSGYIISGGTLAFESGATIDLAIQKTDHTITSAITGKPNVAVQFNDVKAGGVWSGPTWTEIYKGLTFAPSSGTVSLGTASVPKQGSAGDKTGLFLGGTTTGNTIEQILSPGGTFGNLGKFGAGAWTVKGNITIGTIQLEAGKLAIAGTVDTAYKHFNIMSDGILAPGDGLGTVTFADSWNYIENGATIEWEFLSNTTPGTTYDQIVMQPTKVINMSTVTTSININVVGLEGYSVKEGDTFQLLSGSVNNFDANKFNIIGEGTWTISNSGGLLLTSTFSSTPKGTLIFMK